MCKTVSPSMHRLAYIDGLKGFAAILVALGHVVNRFVKAYATAALIKISDIVYSFHMPMFVFISGIVFELSYKNEKEIRKDKYKAATLNLTIMYFVYDVVFIVSKTMVGGFSNPVSFLNLLYLPIKPTGEFWYFYVLILLYLIFRSSFWEEERCTPIALSLLFVVSFLSGILFKRIAFFSINKLAFLALFFYAGMLYAKKKRAVSSPVIVCGSMTIAIILLILYCAFDIGWYSYPVCKTLTAFGMILGFVFLFKNLRGLGENKILVFVGHHAIDVYVIHLYVTEVLWRIYRMTVNNMVIFGIVFITVASIAVSLAIGVLLEKLQLYNLFFKPYKYLKSKQEERQGNN